MMTNNLRALIIDSKVEQVMNDMRNHYTNMSMQYAANFEGCKKGDFQKKKSYIYFLNFCLKHRLWVHFRTASSRRF